MPRSCCKSDMVGATTQYGSGMDGAGAAEALRAAWCVASPGSVVSQRLDQFRLGHRRAALDADLPGPLNQVLLAPVLIRTALAALAADRAARAARSRVRDPRRLFLALAPVAELLIRLLVLDLRSGHCCLLRAHVLLPASTGSNRLTGAAGLRMRAHLCTYRVGQAGRPLHGAV